MQQEAERANNEDILSKFETSPLYFSRTRGLFRECFHGEKDNAPKIGGKINFYRIQIFFIKRYKTFFWPFENFKELRNCYVYYIIY